MTISAATIGFTGTGFAPRTNGPYDGTAGTETIPTGATSLLLTAWGGGAAGGFSAGSPGGGSSGSYTQCTLNCAAGGNMTYSAGAQVAGRSTNGTGANGNQTTITAGTFSLSNITVPGGLGGTGSVGGAAPAAPTNANSGATNTAGNTAVGAEPTGSGSPNGGGDAVGNGTTPGGGGGGKTSGTSGFGQQGRITFYYT